MPFRSLLAAVALLASGAVQAQQPAPSMPLAEAAARRFPQPVRVGDLLRRTVLEPKESQPKLGRVQDVVRRADGGIAVVVAYGGLLGGLLGIGTRPIAVPVEAVALLGEYVQVVGFTPDQLGAFGTFDGAGATPLPPDTTIRVGLARPSH